ncbi:glyoxalase [Bacillus pseudomycoides]|uniref:glyoxalase n=1 Tax=Bacillus pseudomycoides TaxID=64104 RepID=UPI000BEBC761|nr:glyoxalase [Bacillus pseudomycoides]PEE04581.1 glyoxalase [Bacillus pseudomycoides]PHC87224.1 glyoxalase [Bacillus pseudomycoides]
MRKAIEEYIEELHKDSRKNHKLADDAFWKSDLGLAGFYRGLGEAAFRIAETLEGILVNQGEEKLDMKPIENGTFEVTQLLAEAKENEENGN